MLPVVADTGTLFGATTRGLLRPDAFLLTLFEQNPASVAAAFASLRGTLRSAPAPEHLLTRLAADGQVQTAAAMLNAWRQGAVQC